MTRTISLLGFAICAVAVLLMTREIVGDSGYVAFCMGAAMILVAIIMQLVGVVIPNIAASENAALMIKAVTLGLGALGLLTLAYLSAHFI